jgi:CheY-like chemotaxis protein
VATSDRARIVVADDHPRMLDAAVSMLSGPFEVVASVTDGASAIDAAVRLRPDVVVLDIAMPGLDGFETAARIRLAGSGAHIVFLSSHAGDDFVLAGLSRGASAFVAKKRMVLDLVAAVGHAHAGRTFVPSTAVLPRWQRPAGRRHDLQLYATDAFLVDAATAFFEGAFEVGDSILAIASEPHRQALDAQLKARGFDTAALVATGRYSGVDAASALDAVLRNGIPDRDLYVEALDPLIQRALGAAIGSPPHVAVFGEIAPILCARKEFDAMVCLERIASEFAASRPISILCAYSMACLGDQAGHLSTSICAEHSTIIPADPMP